MTRQFGREGTWREFRIFCSTSDCGAQLRGLKGDGEEGEGERGKAKSGRREGEKRKEEGEE